MEQKNAGKPRAEKAKSKHMETFELKVSGGAEVSNQLLQQEYEKFQQRSDFDDDDIGQGMQPNPGSTPARSSTTTPSSSSSSGRKSRKPYDQAASSSPSNMMDIVALSTKADADHRKADHEALAAYRAQEMALRRDELQARATAAKNEAEARREEASVRRDEIALTSNLMKSFLEKSHRDEDYRRQQDEQRRKDEAEARQQQAAVFQGMLTALGKFADKL